MIVLQFRFQQADLIQPIDHSRFFSQIIDVDACQQRGIRRNRVSSRAMKRRARHTTKFKHDSEKSIATRRSSRNECYLLNDHFHNFVLQWIFGLNTRPQTSHNSFSKSQSESINQTNHRRVNIFLYADE